MICLPLAYVFGLYTNQTLGYNRDRLTMRWGHLHKNEYFKKFSSVWKVPCNHCVIQEIYLDCLHSHCLPTFQSWNPNFVSSINIPPLYIRVYRNHKEIFQHELAFIYITSIAAIFCIYLHWSTFLCGKFISYLTNKDIYRVPVNVKGNCSHSMSARLVKFTYILN